MVILIKSEVIVQIELRAICKKKYINTIGLPLIITMNKMF